MKNKNNMTAGEGRWYLIGQDEGHRDENARCTKINNRDVKYALAIGMVYGMFAATVVIMMSLYL